LGENFDAAPLWRLGLRLLTWIPTLRKKQS
jgi:hypothetical protein